MNIFWLVTNVMVSLGLFVVSFLLITGGISTLLMMFRKWIWEQNWYKSPPMT